VAKIVVQEEHLAEISAAVGEFVFSWNLTELALDLIISIIYQCAEGSSVRSSIPYKLNDKIVFCRNCFQGKSVLAPFADSAIPMFAQIETLGDMRHILVHGYPSSITEETKTLHFNRFRLGSKKTILVHLIADVSILKIHSDAKECRELAMRMISLCHELLATFEIDVEAKNIFV
jgi:hypothetical protein